MIGSCHERGEKVATYISNFVHLIGRDAYDISSFVTHRARLTLVFFFNLDAKMDKIGNRDVKVRCQSHLGHVTRIVTRLVSMGYMSLSSVTWHVTECHYLMQPQPETKKRQKMLMAKQVALGIVCLYFFEFNCCLAGKRAHTRRRIFIKHHQLRNENKDWRWVLLTREARR